MTVKLTEHSINTGIKKIEIEATVIRACQSCGMPNPEPFNSLGLPNQYPWESCPRCGTPSVIEKKKVIAYYYRNPFKRFWKFLEGKLRCK